MNTLIQTRLVSWADTDASGRFHFTAPLRWVEDAEHALYRAHLPQFDPSVLPRRAVSSSYRAALRAGEECTVELTLENVGTTSVTYRWLIRAGERVCVEGSHTVVHVDRGGRPSPLPEALQRAVRQTGGVQA